VRKVAGILISLGLLFALAGCGGTAPANESSSNPTPSASQQEEPAAVEEQTSSEPTDAENESPSSAVETDQEDMMENTILVAYFSATGTTEQVAQQAADILDADLYEIVPEEPYTEADLAYYTGGRADQEQDDPNVRPVINGIVENMDQYDTVLLGYPIWHGQAPRIISTFLESYDFAGKTIIPFCTSHSSGVGSSADNLHNLCPDTVNWAEGTRFNGGASSEEIENWLQNQGLYR
jgi:flavodoxin